MNEQLMIFSAMPAPKTYDGQRVVTLRDIDEIHQKPEGSSRYRFRDNRKHFVEGIDFFVAEGGRKTPTGVGEFQNGTILLTLTGYLMIVKSFTDDLSWAIQRELVTGYFGGRRTGKTFLGNPVITVADYCEATGERPGTVQWRLKARYRQFPLGSVLLLEGFNLKLYKEENPEENQGAGSLWVLTQTGAKILAEMFPPRAAIGQ